MARSHDSEPPIVEVRRRGFAVSTSESFEQVTSIAAPIFNPARRSVGAVFVLGASAEILPELERLAPRVLLPARRIVMKEESSRQTLSTHGDRWWTRTFEF